MALISISAVMSLFAGMNGVAVTLMSVSVVVFVIVRIC